MNDKEIKDKDKEFNGVMLNAYPDSIGNTLSDIVKMFQRPELKDAFSLFYVLPTFFNSDLDRGFSIIDYELNKELVSEDDLKALDKRNIRLKFDIVLNHLSMASPQFKDLLTYGKDSKYKDFFINWNDFWKGNGTMNDEGIIIPKEEYLNKLFMRKSGLPILKVPFPDGSNQPYWNTFYQKIDYGKGVYLGQMDVNAKSQLVWDFYEDTLAKLKAYGCNILRLDAFAYLHKEVGQTNFFNIPGTWDYLDRIKKIAEKNELKLLPEIHAEYGLFLHKEVADRGYQIYDFFLPGLIIHTLEKANNEALIKWANEVVENGYKTVNMLGCHDGIPILDLKGKEIDNNYSEGLLSDEEIEDIMNLILDRGGRVKNLYDSEGNKISYYQVNATYFSALGESEEKLLLARAIQLFMPGIPQIWYLDLFAGKNDYDAVEEAGEGGHKEINRTTLTQEDIENGLQQSIVLNQLQLIKIRNTSRAFNGKMHITDTSDDLLIIKWTNGKHFAHLMASLDTYNFLVTYSENGKDMELRF